MSDFEFYYKSIDDATVTYSSTEDSNYPATNAQDRNQNTIFRESTPVPTSVTFDIDFGSGVTRGANANDLILGQFKGTSTNNLLLTVQADDNASFTSPSTLKNQENVTQSAVADLFLAMNTLGGFNGARYWRLKFDDSTSDLITHLEFATVFVGPTFTLSSNPIVGETLERGYNITGNESEAGTRATQARHASVRRRWDYQIEYFDETERTNWETFADAVYVNENGFSRYPFYWSDDGGTTLYYARYIGPLSMEQIAYQAYQKSLVLEEEL